MYYKIENKDCEVYRQLHEMRTEEIQIGKENLKLIEEKVGLKFDNYLGYSGQQNFHRTPQYIGFRFIEPDKVDLQIWQRDKINQDAFVPNKRTKLGRIMSEFLDNGLKRSNYKRPIQILGLEEERRFIFPYVEIAKDLILIYVSHNDTPKDQNVIEITKVEFDRLLNEE